MDEKTIKFLLESIDTLIEENKKLEQRIRKLEIEAILNNPNADENSKAEAYNDLEHMHDMDNLGRQFK